MPGRVEGDVEWPLRDEIADNAELFEAGPCTGAVKFFIVEKSAVAVSCTFDGRKSRRGKIKGEIGAGVFTIEEGVEVKSVMLVLLVVRIVLLLLLLRWRWRVLALVVPSGSGTRGWVTVSREGRWVACVFTERAGTVVS